MVKFDICEGIYLFLLILGRDEDYEVSRFGLEEIIGKKIYVAHLLMRKVMEKGVPYPSSENHIFSPKSNVECYSVSSMRQSMQIGQSKHKIHAII